MNAIEQLKSVLCDHAGKCSIIGSDEDRAIVDRTLQALAAPVQEPVAWIDSVMEQAQVFASAWSLVGGRFDLGNGLEDAEQAKAELRAMLATPPAAKRQWVGLTEQERNDIEDYCEMIVGKPAFEVIEAKLKEKNT